MLGMRTDFDRRFNPGAMRIDAAHAGDHDVSKPFTKHAHHWLVGDDMGTGCALGAR